MRMMMVTADWAVFLFWGVLRIWFWVSGQLWSSVVCSWWPGEIKWAVSSHLQSLPQNTRWITGLVTDCSIQHFDGTGVRNKIFLLGRQKSLFLKLHVAIDLWQYYYSCWLSCICIEDCVISDDMNDTEFYKLATKSFYLHSQASNLSKTLSIYFLVSLNSRISIYAYWNIKGSQSD